MGVLPAGAELSRTTVVALLGRIFEGDDEDSTEGVAKGEAAELVWNGERARTQWLVQPGATGVSQLVVSVRDARPARPAGVYRAEVARVVLLLRDLARATGGRFLVGPADLTGTPLAVVLDMVAPPATGPHGTTVFEDPPSGSGEGCPRR